MERKRKREAKRDSMEITVVQKHAVTKVREKDRGGRRKREWKGQITHRQSLPFLSTRHDNSRLMNGWTTSTKSRATCAFISEVNYFYIAHATRMYVHWSALISREVPRINNNISLLIEERLQSTIATCSTILTGRLTGHVSIFVIKTLKRTIRLRKIVARIR